ncbi:class I SAM-dependent methyltransferase [Gordoniibacillus kamchatkensis]|uniref:class I SAM-dependent methyltransferase n=1 Tax=Gordoniibacillus kamchatkensis TaxID=1590651 RepID=UPI000AB7AFB4|nr:class I SAM-dependent methyltransferase [Paenibacillus sp. VKM B-2647]
MHDRRFNLEHMAELESPERKAANPPEPLLDKLDVRDPFSLLDLGAGTGYFTLPAAERTSGIVFALDIEPRMLDVIRGKAEARQLHNIQTLQGQLENIPLEMESVDRVLASLVLHEAETVDQAVAEMHRVLKSGGICLCLEWEKKETPQGPPVHHRISADELKHSLEQHGFSIIEAVRPTDAQYAVIARKK